MTIDSKTFRPAAPRTGFALSRAKLGRLDPRFRGALGLTWRTLGPGRGIERSLEDHLASGELGPACVVSCGPLVIAAYAEELDAICLLRFPDWLATEHRLTLGERLLVSNRYRREGPLATDLLCGPLNLRQAVDVHPIIADFVTESMEPVAACKAEVDEDTWQRCLELGLERWQDMRGKPESCRDGTPTRSETPAF